MKLTKPGKTDLPWMVGVHTPESCAISFHEHRSIDGENGPAEAAALDALKVPRTAVYIGHIELQGSSGMHGDPDLFLVPVRVDGQLRKMIERRMGSRGRANLVTFLASLLRAELEKIRAPAMAETRDFVVALMHHRSCASGFRSCELDGRPTPKNDPDTDNVSSVTCPSCVSALKARGLL